MLAQALFSELAAYTATRDWQYIYPVWSRRAQGISIGINLHPNHCCNWHCIYCQVPGLQRGPSPMIEIARLQAELDLCLDWISAQAGKHGPDLLSGDLLSPLIQDIAFAGDGEPTTSPQFNQALNVVSQILNHRQLTILVRLITNGSQLQHAHVQHAIQCLHAMGGEVWFKLDAGSDAEMRAVNDSHVPLALHMQRLQTCCTLCRTWVQTAIVSRQGYQQVITTPSLPGYIKALAAVQDKIAGILLYGIARPSQQVAASSLQPVAASVLEDYAKELRAHGFQVRAFD
jgi:wyosine [tRNA(Phe)-imidazoG37] synthetase (radical SAM superfamily)